MFSIEKTALAAMHEHARDDYPAECCGLLTAGPDGVRVHPCDNIQDRLHAENPESYPRDSRIAYYIDPQELYDIVSSAEADGRRLFGIYHSHVDTEAYFSAEDRERAMVWDEPAYPDVVYLVFSVFGGKVAGLKCFVWDEGGREFVEVDSEAGD